MVMNIELKPIAESKVRQLGGTPCGVLVRNEAGALAAVSDMGRVTWLDDCVTQGDCKGECVLPGQGARAQGDAEKEAEKEEFKGDFPLKEESLIRKAARAQGDVEPVAWGSKPSKPGRYVVRGFDSAGTEALVCVPEFMTLDYQGLEMIKTMAGDGETEDEFSECVFWVGGIYGDDGKQESYGLNIACSECLQEGSVTVVLFDAPQPPQEGEG